MMEKSETLKAKERMAATGMQIRIEPKVASKVRAHFGKRLRQWLDDRGIGLVDVAEALGISYSYVSLLGKPRAYGRMLSPPLVVELAEFLQISPDEIFSAMGQINPLLLEQIDPETLERGLMQLHEWLRKQVGKEQASDSVCEEHLTNK